MTKRKIKPRAAYNEQEFREVCAAARTAYIRNRERRVPTIEEVEAVCSLPRKKMLRVMADEQFVNAMESTGINWRKNKGLTSDQHLALLVLTDPNDRRPYHRKLDDIGCTPAKYRSWMRNPLFSNLINEFVSDALDDHKVVADTALMQKVATGDVPALNLYYAMTGIYDPREKQERDVQAVIHQLTDIITRLVPVEYQAAIAEEIARLQGRTKPKPLETRGFRDEMPKKGLEPTFVAIDEVKKLPGPVEVKESMTFEPFNLD